MIKSKAEIHDIVLRHLAELTSRHADKIGMTDRLVTDLRADGDDLSFLFVPGVERDVGVDTPADSWSQVATVADAINLLYASQQAAIDDRRGRQP